MIYSREQIEGFAREAEVLATDPAFNSGSPDWVISRNKHVSAMLRQLLTESEAQILKLRAGDTVVLSVPRILSREQAERIRTHAEPHLPEGVKVLVLDAGVTLEVLRHEQ